MRLQSPSDHERFFNFSICPKAVDEFSPIPMSWAIMDVEQVKQFVRETDYPAYEAWYIRSNFAKRCAVEAYLSQSDLVWMPTIHLYGSPLDGLPQIYDGRHRFMVLEESYGFRELPIAFPETHRSSVLRFFSNTAGRSGGED